MNWRFFKESKVVRHFKTHRLYYLLALIFGWVMSNFLTTPTISAVAIILIVYLVLVILLDNWIRSKICRWIKSEFCCNRIIYFGLLIICILTALPFWNTLVYICDRDNPYKQPLRTGEGRIEVIAEPNGVMGGALRSFGGWGDILLIKDGNNIILEMGGVAARKQNENGQVVFWSLPKLDAKDKSVNKPIYHLTEAEYAVIRFEKLPPCSRIINGEIIITFNSSVIIKIPIPPQTMENDAIIIPDIQKYF